MEDIVVNIVANVHSFNQGLLAAGTAFARFSQQLISDVAKTANAQQQFADSITESYQGLRSLQYAAGTTGVGMDAFNQALTRMNSTIGKAAIGNEEAADTLNALGLSVKNLINLSPSEQFKAIADAVAKVPSGATRAALTIGIFGKESRQLVNVLASGSKGIEELRNRFDSLHGVTGRFAVAGIDIGRQALEDMGIIVDGLAHKLAENLYPWFKVGLKYLEDWGLTGSLLGEKMDAAFEWAYTKLPNALEAIIAKWNEIENFQAPSFGDILKSIDKGGATLTGFEAGAPPLEVRPWVKSLLNGISALNPEDALTRLLIPENQHVGVQWANEDAYGGQPTDVRWAADNVYGGLREGTPSWLGSSYKGTFDSYEQWMGAMKAEIFGGPPVGGALDMTGAKIRSGGMGKYGIPGMIDVALQQSADMERSFQAMRDRAMGNGNIRGKTADLGFGISLNDNAVSASALAMAKTQVQEVSDEKGNRWLEKIHQKIGTGGVAS